MAPQNRIWGLNDVANNNNSGYLRDDNNDEPQNMSFDDGYHHPLAAPYCQPAASAAATSAPPSGPQSSQDVHLACIPNLLHGDVCSSTLQRVVEDFFPIIQRRKYNVLSISEMCCCGDGLDYDVKTKQRTRRRQLKKQSPNVWGYNCTRFLGRGQKSHTIHLRLRDARSHLNLLQWEDVAGTMAHELSHCIHQNHGPAFYELMEEILEEHATLMANRLTSTGFLEPLNRNVAQRNNNGNSDTSSLATNDYTMPESGGNRLGGSGGAKGRSRLLDGIASAGSDSGGRRLGGSNRSSSKYNDPDARREAMAKAAMGRAAATRSRLLERTRRMMERAKEPCVIEILDDTDDEDDSDSSAHAFNEMQIAPSTTRRPQHHHKQDQENDDELDQKPKAKRKSGRDRREDRNAATAKSAATSKTGEDGGTGPPKRAKKKVETIDLTATTPERRRKKNPMAGPAGLPKNDERGSIAVVAAVAVNPSIIWVCSKCTFRNRPLALVCDVCLSQRC